jgi:hypothetical protein
MLDADAVAVVDQAVLMVRTTLVNKEASVN